MSLDYRFYCSNGALLDWYWILACRALLKGIYTEHYEAYRALLDVLLSALLDTYNRRSEAQIYNIISMICWLL